ncbi:MAG: hypothetical protein Q7S12_03460 [bacterium]|nr:hypothetical protein [bacterium]
MEITIARKRIEKQKGVVVLPLAEYRKLLERAVPEHWLSGKSAKKLDILVENGLRDLKGGKTIRANSISEALNAYRGKNGR